MRLLKATFFILSFIFAGCSNQPENSFVASGIMEGTDVKVSAQTGGLILRVAVEDGQQVAEGQVIAVIDTEKLGYQLEQIQAGIEEMNVQKSIAQNILQKSKLEYEHIQTKYLRFQDLYKKSSASKQMLDDLKNAFDQASTQLENARQNLAVLESKRKGLLAQKKLVQRQIQDATVTAPFAGTVTTQFYQAGETVPPGAPVVELIDLNQMWTKVYISEKQLSRIKVGQSATIKVDGSDETFSGQVVWISAKAEFTPKNILTEENRTSLVYAVKVEVDNPDKILKHGMPVEIALNYEIR
ncbi:MAG: HlyD family secretion protein [bacterium]